MSSAPATTASSSAAITTLAGWQVVANPALQKVQSDASAITTAAGFSDATGVHSSCPSLKTDVTKVQVLPPPPDQTAEGYLAQVMSNYAHAADSCLNCRFSAASPSLYKVSTALDQLKSYLQSAH